MSHYHGFDIGDPTTAFERAEKALLGAMIMDAEALDLTMKRLPVECFGLSQHKTIYRAMADLSDRRQPFDFISLTDSLREKNQLVLVGGAGYVAHVARNAAARADLNGWIRLLEKGGKAK
jgi:replicative DNA helicase